MLVSFVLLWIFICFIFVQFKSRRPKNFPPGPSTLPVLGNLHNLSLDNPLQDFERMRRKYGNVFSLYLGSRPVVMLCGIQVIKEALVNKAVEFAGRPQDLLVNFTTQNKGMIMADYGPKWKEHRRFSLTILRNFGLGKQSMEERILGELKHTIAALEKSIGSTLCPDDIFHNTSSNIICQVLFGMRFDHDDFMIKEVVRCFSENATLANGPWSMLYESVPIVRHLPLPFKKAFTNTTTLQSIVVPWINEHIKTRVPGQPRDLVDCYLDEKEKRSKDSSTTFSEDVLSMFVPDIHFAATDTTSNTLLTGFLYLMNHPHIQERCQEEIDRVLEGRENACFEDRHNMPYVQAVIHEIQRVTNIAPLAVYHTTTTDTQIMGYSIPKGTMVFPNLSSVLSEVGQWKFPHGFHPENFLNDQGEYVKPEAFIPFSLGPRTCMGEGLARIELFLITVTLLRKFKFIWPQDAGEPDFTPIFGITTRLKPYCMKVQLREKH